MPNIIFKLIVRGERAISDLQKRHPALSTTVLGTTTGLAVAHFKGSHNELQRAKQHLANTGADHDVEYDDD